MISDIPSQLIRDGCSLRTANAFGLRVVENQTSCLATQHDSAPAQFETTIVDPIFNNARTMHLVAPPPILVDERLTIGRVLFGEMV